jgi:hypothetical protein
MTGASVHEDDHASSPMTARDAMDIDIDINNCMPRHTTPEIDISDTIHHTTPGNHHDAPSMDIDNTTRCTNSDDDDDDDPACPTASHPTASVASQHRASSLVKGDHLPSVHRKRTGKSIYRHQSKKKKSRAKHAILQSDPVSVFTHGSKQYPIWVDIDGDVSVVFIIVLLFLIFLFLFQPMLEHDLLDFPVPLVCRLHQLYSSLLEAILAFRGQSHIVNVAY